MSHFVQQLLVYAAIFAAAVYVARAMWKSVAAKKAACGACPGCAKSEPDVVAIASLGASQVGDTRAPSKGA
ncbi:MAG TPA: FeoB-associated Cys-rich membrane protein [Pirellulales bacterium]|jgi:hypothetical protein|nr:FeoB-associated Cys-rich membrane protein [Pirellulales bacterium]